MHFKLLAPLLFLFVQFETKAQSLKELKDSLRYYAEKEDYFSAVLIAEKTTLFLKNQFGDNNKDYASSLNNLGFFYDKSGSYEKSEKVYLEALALRKKLLGQRDPAYAISLNNIASLYYNMNNYAKAEQMFIEALDIRKEVLGSFHPDYVLTINNLITLYETMGNYNAAIALSIELLNIYKKKVGENDPQYANCLNNLGMLYEQIGDLNKAKPMYTESLNIRKKVLGENHSDYASSLNNLASLYASTGNYSMAEPLYVEALNIRKISLGETDPAYASSLNNLGDLYLSLGNYTKAETLFKEAVELRRKILSENSLDYATSINNLAKLYYEMANYAKAEALFIESLNIREKILGKNSPSYAISLNNLATLYESMGNNNKAELFFLDALLIWKQISGEKNPEYTKTLNNLALLYINIGNYEKAELFLSVVSSTWRETLGDTHPNYASSLFNLAALYEDKGDYNKAEPFMVKAADIIATNILENFSALSENEKEKLTSKYLYLNILLNLQQKHKKITPASTQFIFNQQLLFKSLILANSKSLLQNLQNSNDTVLQNRYASWLGIKKQLAQQYSLPLTKRSNELADWEKQAEGLEKQLNGKSSALRSEQQAIHINMAHVQKVVFPNEAVIEFVRFKRYNKKWMDSVMYAAYILKKNDSIPVFVPLCEEKQLQKLIDSAGSDATALVNSFYRGITPDEENNNKAGLGKQLYHLIWQPLEPHLKGIKKIAYSPAGNLYSIAFHAMAVDSVTTLMDKYELQQYTSTRNVALRTMQQKSNKLQNITLFGNPTFTMDSTSIVKTNKTTAFNTTVYTPPNRNARGGSWNELPGTAAEVKKINDLFTANKSSTKFFTGTNASEGNIKALSGHSPQVLHIATHGFFLPDPEKKKRENDFSQADNTYSLANDPLLRSGLILAGGNYAWNNIPIDGVEDGILTAYEIAQLDLSNTELVVLSACETALGDIKGSEGVFGLQRAFKMAGVKKMIVSLWQVPDKETAELMTAFYAYWLGGKTIEEAFATAQADMKKKYPPFYWAAFVLVE